MSEKRFVCIDVGYGDDWYITDNGKRLSEMEIVDLLNEQQELIEELHISDHMGWGRAEKFEKELKQKKIYIKRLEYKVQKFKEMNGEQQATIEQLKAKLKEKEEDERLYANEILELRETNKEHIKFKSLGGDY